MQKERETKGNGKKYIKRNNQTRQGIMIRKEDGISIKINN